VLEGEITLSVGDETHRIGPGEICFVAAGVTHSLVEVTTPYRGFVIRAPAVSDKEYVSAAHPGDV
jgi:quercetin dioxygenase-like cupin family protein